MFFLFLLSFFLLGACGSLLLLQLLGRRGPLRDCPECCYPTRPEFDFALKCVHALFSDQILSFFGVLLLLLLFSLSLPRSNSLFLPSFSEHKTTSGLRLRRGRHRQRSPGHPLPRSDPFRPRRGDRRRRLQGRMILIFCSPAPPSARILLKQFFYEMYLSSSISLSLSLSLSRGEREKIKRR